MFFLPKRKARFDPARRPTRPIVILVTKNHQDELQRYLIGLTSGDWFREGGEIYIWDLHSLDRTKAVAEKYTALYPNQIHWTSDSPELPYALWVGRFRDEPMVEVVNLPGMDARNGYLPPGWWKCWFERLRRKVRSERRKPDPERIVDIVERERVRVYELVREHFLEPLAHVEMLHAHAEASASDLSQLDRLREIYNKSAARMRTAALLLDPGVWRGGSLYHSVLSYCDGVTERTHLPCEVVERGAERRLPEHIGISLMRIVGEWFALVASSGGTQRVDVDIRWVRRGVVLRLKAHGGAWEERRSAERLAIAHRASMVEGAVRWSTDSVAVWVPCPVEEAESS
ncbi:hypothetical protein [Paenibacillus sp.]|uniref:hypothetical protein n=1 Tax=Paenibacillus sp. TaxID=58172 RepID=UPI002D23862C|nr:hypothetical protein [Paenibacillus sp.]HZG58205.1 hypothetical protein [Paenibacillus sp.]